MKIQKLAIAILVLITLVACNVKPVLPPIIYKLNNPFRLNDSDLELDAVSLPNEFNSISGSDLGNILESVSFVSVQQGNPLCKSESSPNNCIVTAEGLTIQKSVPNIPNLPPNPNTIISDIGFTEAKIELPKGKSVDDLPNTFNLTKLVGYFWAQDGNIDSKPEDPDLEVPLNLNDDSLKAVVFTKKEPCPEEYCIYSVEEAKAKDVITLEIPQVSDFIDVFGKGTETENTVGLIFETDIESDQNSAQEKDIFEDSIFTLTLTNPTATTKGVKDISKAELTINITIQSGLNGNVIVTGPNGSKESRIITENKTLDLAIGKYTITAKDVISGKETYTATVFTNPISLGKGQQTAVKVLYENNCNSNYLVNDINTKEDVAAIKACPSIIGSVIISSNNNLESLDLTGLTSVSNDLAFFSNHALTNSNLSDLRSIGGHLDFADNRVLTSVDLANLKIVRGHVDFTDNDVLKAVDLTNLTPSVGDHILFSDNDALETVDLTNLESVDGKQGIIFDKNHNLKRVDFTNLTRVSGHLDFTLNEKALTNIDLGKLATVGGNLGFFNNNKLINIDLSNLTTVEQDIGLAHNIALKGVNLTNLTGVGNELDFSNNSALVSIDLPKLTIVGHDLSFFENIALESINLTNLERVEGSLNFSDNLALTTFRFGKPRIDVNANLGISGNNLLTNLDELAKIYVAGTSTINDNLQLDCTPYNSIPYLLAFFPVTESTGNLVDCATK